MMSPLRGPLLAASLFTLAGCAGHRQCDYVLFVPMNCVDPARLVASRTLFPAARPHTNTPAVAKKVEPTPAPPPPVAVAPDPPPPPPPAALPEIPSVNAVY